MQILVVTADESILRTFRDVSWELGIETRLAPDVTSISNEVGRRKYEAVVMDFDSLPKAGPMLSSVQNSSSSKNAVVFAVATDLEHVEQALKARSHFVLQRPIEPGRIRQTLERAYDFMRGESRRQFRYAAVLSVKLTSLSSGKCFQCSTLNVSSNGMCVNTTHLLKPAEMLDILLELSDESAVRATGIVVWQDENGRCGLNFRCASPAMRERLDAWIDLRFEDTKQHDGSVLTRQLAEQLD